MIYEHTLSISTCLEIAATGTRFDRATVSLERPIAVFVAEFDCALDVAYWDANGSFEWEVRAVTIEDGAFISGGTFTEKTDPLMWAIIKRAVKDNFASIDEQVQERAHEREAA